MSFRKERKFRLTSYEGRALKGRLLRNGMTPLHPDRNICSQYFDTPDFRSFEESEEGILPRRKTRVRWYNNDQSKLTLERKVSSIEGRFKTSEPVTSSAFRQILMEGIIDPVYGRLVPSAIVCYRRSYFNYNGLRITFDRDITYQIKPHDILYRDFEEVVEIKVPYEMADDAIEQLIEMPTSRFSKYGRAFLARHRAL